METHLKDYAFNSQLTSALSDLLISKNSSKVNQITLLSTYNLSSHSLFLLLNLRPDSDFFFIPGTLFDLSDKDLHCVEEQQIFDRLYSLVKRYSCLNHSSRLNLVEALRSNLGVLIPSIESLAQVQSLEGSSDSDSPPSVAVVDKLVSYRNALRIYTFLLLSIVSFQEDTQQESKVFYAHVLHFL